MDRPYPTTAFRLHGRPFGRQADAGERCVSQRGRSATDPDERLMSAGLHRVWKDLTINALNPPRSDTPFALLDVAGGHRRHRVPCRRGGGPRLPGHRLRHQFGYAWMSAARARRPGISTTEYRSSRAMPRHWLFRTAPSTPIPSHSASATCRGSILRWRRRFACSSRAADFCAWNSPLLTCPASIESTTCSRSGDSAARPRGDRDTESYQYLVESIRKFPKPGAFAEMMRDAGFSASSGRASRAASWHCIRAGVCDFSAMTHIARLARAGFVFAREGVFGVVDPSLVPPPASSRFASRG